MRARSFATSTKKDRQTDAHPVTQEKKTGLPYIPLLNKRTVSYHYCPKQNIEI